MEFCDTADWKSALRPAGSGYVTEFTTPTTEDSGEWLLAHLPLFDLGDGDF
jgi:hypothetical protein